MKKMLLVFDFDHTIVDDNSDMIARSLISESSIPNEEAISKMGTIESWTDYMNQIFIYLHKEKVTEDQIISAIHNVLPIKGMDSLLKLLDDDCFDVIIISDSNSIFINEWLKSQNLDRIVKRVISNPANFDESGLLSICYYEKQNHCNLSEPNLCKGNALLDYINNRRKENVSFERIAFIGDGSNDLCPVLRLRENDLVFPRACYALEKKIQENKNNVKGNVFPWKTGHDIIDILKNKFNLFN